VAELVLVECDFFSAARAEGAAGLPRLPLLEALLARADRRAISPDWRGWLAPRFGGATGSLASTVAAAWNRPPVAAAPGGVWLATPVHFFAGIDSVHLHPAGVLQLEPAEQQQLVADFSRVFADSSWALHSIGRRELLLSGPALEASGADPDDFAGSDPYAGLPQGEGAARLRALGAEIEMWLYEHALNRERSGRGELSVTALWLWGARARPAVAGAPASVHAQPPRLYGADSYLEALCRLHGGDAQALPSELTVSQVDSRTDSVLLYRRAPAESPTAALARFERCWLPAALQALRQGRVSVLRLALGAHAYRVRHIDLARIWRRRRPWWQVLQ
jgi:hypothetical protein